MGIDDVCDQLKSIDEFGPASPEALRRGFCSADKAVVLIDGAIGLANMAKFTLPGLPSNRRLLPCPGARGLVLDALIDRRIPITSLGFTTGQEPAQR